MQATAARRVAKSIATICASFLLLSLFFVQLRYVGMTAGLLPVQKAEASVVARAPHFDGSGTVSVEYCSEVVAGHDADNPSGLTSTNLAFDDAWLERDSFAYQHQLATACSVLAAVCNSESQFYGGVEGAKPYAELALGALGFNDVRTDSYALRSGILDEIGALFAGSHDVAAYTLASKTVPGKKGEPPTTILFVGIRGSYGIEWLSNFNFMNPADADHQGFKAAEREIEEALFDYARERGADPAHTRVLVTGHSRGGAIANLLAARLDNLDGSPQQLAPARNVFAYTFAAPCATKTPDRQAASYGNVFTSSTNPTSCRSFRFPSGDTDAMAPTWCCPTQAARRLPPRSTTCRTPTGATRAWNTVRTKARLTRWSPSRPKRHATCPTSIRWQARRAFSGHCRRWRGWTA